MPSHENVDVMALTSGVVSAAITTYLSDGYYGIGNALFSAAIIFTIIAYVANRKRDALKMVAFAASLAVASLPAAGLLVEFTKQEHKLAFLSGSDNWYCSSHDTVYPVNGKETTDEAKHKYRTSAKNESDGIQFRCIEGAPQSNVNDRDLLFSWLIFFVMTILFDRSYQAKLRREAQQED